MTNNYGGISMFKASNVTIRRNLITGTGAAGDTLGFKQIPTTGSILVLDMGRVIQLSQEFDAPGNIGQFSFQVPLV
jgi:hypothetical protein